MFLLKAKTCLEEEVMNLQAKLKKCKEEAITSGNAMKVIEKKIQESDQEIDRLKVEKSDLENNVKTVRDSLTRQAKDHAVVRY